MPKSENKFRTSVKLVPDKGIVAVQILEKESGSVVESADFLASEIHGNLRPNVGLYGLSKLLQDRSSDVPTGPGKLAAMKEVLAQLTAGNWEKERKVGATVVSSKVEALARLKCNGDIAAAQRALKNYAKDARERILNNKTILDLAAQIETEREAKAAISLDDLDPTPPAAAEAVQAAPPPPQPVAPPAQ